MIILLKVGKQLLLSMLRKQIYFGRSDKSTLIDLVKADLPFTKTALVFWVRYKIYWGIKLETVMYIHNCKYIHK